jgi:hypothetical protein
MHRSAAGAAAAGVHPRAERWCRTARAVRLLPYSTAPAHPRLPQHTYFPLYCTPRSTPGRPRRPARARRAQARYGRPWLLQGHIYGAELLGLCACCRIAQPPPTPPWHTPPIFLSTARPPAPQAPPPAC